MELRHLRYFLKLAQTGHLTRAAEHLFVTQSTLSHGLRQLEQELGAALFERVGRGLRITEAGRTFRDHAARAIQEIETGRMALVDLGRLHAGSLTIGAIPSFAFSFIPQAVSAFSARYPNVEVAVRERSAGPIEEGVLAGQFNVAISVCPAERAGIDAEPLFVERMVLAVGTGHRLASRRRLPMKALAEVSLALHPRTFVTRRLTEATLRAAGIVPRVRLEMDSIESLASVCRHGELAAILPERAARRAAGLQVIPLHSPALCRTAGVLWRQGSSRSVAALEFVRLLRALVDPG